MISFFVPIPIPMTLLLESRVALPDPDFGRDASTPERYVVTGYRLLRLHYPWLGTYAYILRATSTLSQRPARWSLRSPGACDAQNGLGKPHRFHGSLASDELTNLGGITTRCSSNSAKMPSRGGRSSSHPWGRLRAPDLDPLESMGLPSKGDNRFVVSHPIGSSPPADFRFRQPTLDS